VNRLPPEVLSQIIGYVAHEHDTDPRDIIRLTHVCRYWHEFIVSMPRNWTSISSKSKGLAALGLQRAKGAPPKLCLDVRQVREQRGFSDLINSKIQNAETLRFSGFDNTATLTRTFPKFTQPMPNLRSLTLDGSGRGERESSADPFGSLAPTLRYLKLTDVPLYPSFLRLRALTELVLTRHYSNLQVHLDTLLDFLEENRSLESVDLGIGLVPASLFGPRRRGAIVNQLRHLSITHNFTAAAKELLSNIPLQKGAHLEIITNTSDETNDVLPGIPAAQFPILLSPAFLEYQSHQRRIRLFGPNGSFSFQCSGFDGKPFGELPLLPLTDVREFHLKHRRASSLKPVVFNPSFFPALETFSIDCGIQVSHLLSTLFSDPSFPHSLKTLAFLNCDLSGDSMEVLTQFSFDRTKTTSAWLRRVVIIDSKGNLPSVDSINALRKCVPIVNVGVGEELPTDLA
jgi:hypothetical protein